MRVMWLGFSSTRSVFIRAIFRTSLDMTFRVMLLQMSEPFQTWRLDNLFGLKRRQELEFLVYSYIDYEIMTNNNESTVAVENPVVFMDITLGGSPKGQSKITHMRINAKAMLNL